MVVRKINEVKYEIAESIAFINIDIMDYEFSEKQNEPAIAQLVERKTVDV